MAIKEIEVPPDAARTIEGLRDTGYDPYTALADIVDNSIAADASQIAVRVSIAMDGELEVSIADNGYGMSESQLLDAMRYGSQGRRSPASLGKFGLGLKTASTSICRQLTVVSRTSGTDARAAQWDLDYVAAQDKWLLRLPDVSARELELLDEVAANGSGTVVIWRSVDRLLSTNYRDNEGAASRTALKKIVDQLRRHLALTYVRYLGGENGRPKVSIDLNDEPVNGWDPFWRTRSEILLDKVVEVALDGEPASFSLRAYVLPPRTELSEAELRDADIVTQRQGFYVFREDRVISAGTWLGMFSVEPHFNLCRIDFSFDHRLDDALQIDIKKSRIRMLADLQNEVKRLVGPARSEAEQRYRKNQRSVIKNEGTELHAASNAAVSNHIESLSRSSVTVTGPDEAIVATPRGRVTISIPTIAESEGGPHVIVVDEITDGLLWRPGIVDGQKAVLLNAGHPFYQRVYSALVGSPVGIQAIDFLLWALSEAELWAVSPTEKDHMAAVRREVSRITRELSNVLPEVEASRAA